MDRLPGKIFALGLLLVVLGLPARGQEAARGQAAPAERELVRGMTISCQTWGQEWARAGFADELDRLQALGVNWVAIHPYARIRADGTVSWRGDLEGEAPPWIARPIAAARARGMGILIKPHLAYWGSPFRWRGDIRFDEPEARARFWETYSRWIRGMARFASGADAFCVGTELRGLLGDEERWRELVRDCREVTPAHLTYAANWDAFREVGFWDALDAIGVQAYFPLSQSDAPGREELRAGWRPVVEELEALGRNTGKPVVFTELGYHTSLAAAREPWSDRGAPAPARDRARDLQVLCFEVALEVLERESTWLRGAFLWKWFVGPTRNESFLVDTPHVREVLRRRWGAPAAGR